MAYGVAVWASDVYITGTFSGTANFNTPSAAGSNEITAVGTSDIFLAKYDNTGSFLWAKRAGGTSTDIAYGVAVSAAEVYITGYIRGIANFNTPSVTGSNEIRSVGAHDIFLAKYDYTGSFHWAKRAGGTSVDMAYGVAASGSDVYITGFFNGTADFNTPSAAGSNEIISAGGQDIFLAKYDNTGRCNWVKRAGGTSNALDIAYGVAVSVNDVYITGAFSGTADFNTPSAAGSNEIISAGGQDIFLAKYDNAGSFQWAKRAGGTSTDIANGVAVSGSDVYITGAFSGTADFNTPSAAGSNEIISAGDQDIFLAKYDNTGSCQWAKRAGGTSTDIANGVAVSGSDVYITGFFQNTANFNTPSATGSNELTTVSTAGDVFLVRYANTVLPIELLRFSGKTTEKGNLLTWQTASETNNKGFEIERSAEGSRFEKIGFVAGNGTTNSTQSYTFIDNTPNNGISYYRLKQLDFNGSFEYSKIVSVRQEGKSMVSIFPNPSKGIFTIKGLEDLEDEQFVIINSIGQTFKPIKLRILWNQKYSLSCVIFCFFRRMALKNEA